MRTLRFFSLVALALLLAALPGRSMCVGIDLSAGFDNNEQRQKLLIVTGVTQPVAKLAPNERTPFREYPTDRTLMVDRVLFGPAVAKGARLPFIVPSGGIDGNGDGRLVEAKPVLIILRQEEAHWIFGSGIFYKLGPVNNCLLPLKSLDDPQVDLVQRMVDFASIPSAAARWERVQALLPMLINIPPTSWRTLTVCSPGQQA